jgi:hypothetical protein
MKNWISRIAIFFIKVVLGILASTAFITLIFIVPVWISRFIYWINNERIPTNAPYATVWLIGFLGIAGMLVFTGFFAIVGHFVYKELIEFFRKKD